jgi:[NiFe] hydrogenase assembly HybE family chaperone
VSDAETIAARFESTFANIRDTRMRDLPMLNEALPVKAVGFREWGEYWLGVLITPWFMNLVLSPVREASHEWHEGRVSDRVRHAFPAGEYEFLLGEEAGVGRYQMCSLFPSMYVFANEEAAVAAAQAVLAALFEAGEETRLEQTILTADSMAALSAPSERKTPKAISRRALLTGFNTP